MLKFGNKEFRNLQEQVLRNMKNIQDIMDGTTVLAESGIKVIGHVNSAADLPDPETPVTAIKVPNGNLTLTFFKLLTFAPLSSMNLPLPFLLSLGTSIFFLPLK